MIHISNGSKCHRSCVYSEKRKYDYLIPCLQYKNMQIKNKLMEFTNKQEKQLQQIKNLAKLQQLQAKCEKIKQELEYLITKRSESLSEREMLIECIKSLQEDLEKTSEEYDRQIKLKEENELFLYDNNDHLQSICLILGYQISACQLLDNNGIQITLCYRDICYVTYIEASQMFDLIEICPQHYNFPHIKEFLHRSQDLRGLLSCLRNFFDLALECKEKQEQN